MDMAVVQLFLGSIAHIHHLHVEMKGLSCQRVVGVDGNIVAGYVHDGDNLGTSLAAGLELHSRRYFRVGAEFLFIHLEYKAFVPLP